MHSSWECVFLFCVLRGCLGECMLVYMCNCTRTCTCIHGNKVHTGCVPFYKLDLVCLALFHFQNGLSAQPWLSWNSLCKPGWPQTDKRFTCLCLSEAYTTVSHLLVIVCWCGGCVPLPLGTDAHRSQRHWVS